MGIAFSCNVGGAVVFSEFSWLRVPITSTPERRNAAKLVVWRLILEMEVLKKISVRSCSAFNRAAYIQPCSESSDAQGLILHHHSQVQLGE
jgi:hypothetical protein